MPESQRSHPSGTAPDEQTLSVGFSGSAEGTSRSASKLEVPVESQKRLAHQEPIDEIASRTRDPGDRDGEVLRQREAELDLRLREGKFHLERQLIVFRMLATIIIFTGGIILALNGLQDIGLFVSGCAMGLLSEAKGGTK